MLVVAIGLIACSAWAARPDPVRFGASVEQGNLEAVKAWLEEGLEADFPADRIGSGLMIAAWEGNIPMMELFLSHGAQINLSNRHDEQALQLAAWRGHLEAVQWLLAHGAVVNRPGRWNALHYAAFADHSEIVRLLLAQGAQIDARAPNGSTALMMTAREGREELARQLLDAGADPRATNESGDSALTWAMRHEHFRIAQMVSSAEEFARASRASPESFGPRVRSQPAPSEIEEILRQIRLAQAAGKPVEALRKAMFEAVARFKKDSQQLVVGKVRPAKPARRGKPQALVITAKRGQDPKTGSERAELVYAKAAAETSPQPGDVAEILEKLAQARAAGRPQGDLRKALFEAVARFKQESP
ncbi:MAG: ankyrin repeat domain-containing protein [Sterolibacterium sp.]